MPRGRNCGPGALCPAAVYRHYSGLGIDAGQNAFAIAAGGTLGLHCDEPAWAELRHLQDRGAG
jgi:hypothetical protein